MAQSTYSIRMDDKLKKTFDELCDSFGMTATIAFNIFAKKVVQEKKIPFIISVDDEEYDEAKEAFKSLRNSAKKNKIQGMPLEKINSIIDSVRKEK